MESRPFINYPGNIATTIEGLIKLDPTIVLYGWSSFGILFATVLCWVTYKKFRNPNTNRVSPWGSVSFILIVAIGVFVLRLPNLILKEQNPDESQLIVNAATFLNGAVLWKSVTAHTAGPFLFIPPTIMYFLGEGLNYASVRLFGLLCCIIPTIIIVFFLLKKIFNTETACLLLIPLALYFSFVNSHDIIAHETEQIPMLFTALSILLLFSLVRNNQIHKPLLFSLGVLLGLFPFAKLQAIPIAFVIGICVLLEFFLSTRESTSVRIKNLFLFFGAGLIPALLVLVYLLSYNAFIDFWNDYILVNIHYTSHGINGRVTHGLKRWFLIIEMLKQTADILWLFGVLSVMILFAILFFIKNKILKQILTNRKIIYLFLIVLLSYISVHIPGGVYNHYQVLLVVPLAILGCVLFGYALQAQKGLLSSKIFFLTYFFVVAVTPLMLMLNRGNKGIDFVSSGNSMEPSAVSKEIKKYAAPNEKMAIWGWQDKYFVETELTQGLTGAHVFNEILGPKENNPYLDKYVVSLDQSKPVIFLDAIAPGAFYFKYREREGHDKFPIVDNYISANYTQVAEIDLRRIYVLNTRLEQLKKNF